jgi:molybdopterin molybdotransferase
MAGPLLPLDEALRILAQALPSPQWPEVRADRDEPALDRSAMDGAALRAAEGFERRRITGALHAGEDPAGFRVGPGEALRIMTGAALPEGADAVVPVEQLLIEGATLTPQAPPKTGANVLRKGSHSHAGDCLLPAGHPLTAAGVGLRAQVGAVLPPLRRIRVGIAPTGDEVVADPAPHQIRDSNGPMLAALAHRLGAEVTRMAPLPDDPEALRQRLGTLQDLNILLTIGGVSMGEKDFLPAVLNQLGATLLFQKIRLKPGKPMLAALLGDLVVLGLPGNPLSAYLNALLFLPVALARLEGWAAPDPWKTGHLAEPVPNPGDRPLLQPCALKNSRLLPLPSRGSADLASLARADACAWIPEGGHGGGAARYLTLL